MKSKLKIVRARLKPMGGATEFISVKGRIKSLIENNPGDIFDFVIEDEGIKSVKSFGPENINKALLGQEVPIVDKIENAIYFAKFNKDGSIDVTFGDETNEGALPRQSTINQLKRIRKITKGIDIGDRIPDMKKQGANVAYIHNPVDTGIESYEDFEKHNKSFVPSWNLKHLISPFRNDNGHGKSA